jgi:hypothetical protein
VLILSRKQGSTQNKRNKLFHFDKARNPGASQHSEFYICPFTPENVQDYLKRFVTQLQFMDNSSEIQRSVSVLEMVKEVTHNTRWEEWSEGGENRNSYFRWFKRLPDLFQLGTTPLILNLILCIMPKMLNEDCSLEFRSENEATRLTELTELCKNKTGIYQLFTTCWFEFQADRIWKSQIPADLFGML